MTGKIPQELQDKAKEFILEKFKLYSDRSGLETKWEKWDKLFNNITTEKFYEGQANLFPPETRRACKTIINFIDEVLFNSDPPFRIKGVGGKNDEAKAGINARVIMWQQQKINLRQKVRAMIEILVKYGFVIVKVPYVLKEKYIINKAKERENLIEKIKGMFFGEIAKDKLTTYDNIDFIPLNIRSVYWNYFDTWENQVAIIERREVTFNHLKALEKARIYFDVDRVKDSVRVTSTVPTDPTNIQNAEAFSHIKDITGLSGDFCKDKKRYELLECSCNFDIDNDGIDEECIMCLVNREHVVRMELNDYPNQEKPYLWTAWDNIEGTSLGMGLPQLAECSQIALNDFTNQIMDNITFILNCMKVVDDLAEIPNAQLKSRPNGVIKSKTGVDAVKFMTPPMTASEGLKAVAMIKDDIRNVTGATVSLQGLPARYNTTASEYQAQGNASSRDVFSKVREIEDRIIKPFLRMAYQYNLKYLTREDFIKIIGEDAATVFFDTYSEVSEGIEGDYDFMPLGITQIENKIVKTQQMINFLNIVSGLPPGIVDLSKLVAKIWKNTGDGDDIILQQPTDELISPNDENILMGQGEAVHAKMMENHQQHLVIHIQAQLPPELMPLRDTHIQEHQQIMSIMMSKQNQLPAPAQEQPRLQPDTVTEGNIAKDTQAPQVI